MTGKILFASDLDQTLIYSRRSMGDYGHPHLLVPIEEYKGRIISYMTTLAVKRFCEAARQAIIVPVTTRTVEQYRRVKLPIRPSYAVVSNGGHILREGHLDKKWHDKILSQISDKCLDIGKMEREFAKIAKPDWVTSSRRADQLFLYFLIERDKVPSAELKAFACWAQEQNWRLSIQGRKLYLVPKPVSKWTAVEEVLKRVGKPFVVAAGDSLLDQEMLEKADLALAPAHGELWATHGPKKRLHHHGENEESLKRISFLPQQGIVAGEAILNHLLALCEDKKESSAISS
ncbi:HAD hydrolase family protein [Heliorestis acidaminivorans]|uniref:HAD hydrolase family protein n=1 Tax=Heliorestis acidaminivorans TaxID=553427 RepID=A0A6I0ETW3_9FIRM|nr:HAD hydrolase family protein [Heliorestis acidaminivorans]KAB2952610.1 HAD hydrolase family protein [Heliorestis acidaminivorans]